MSSKKILSMLPKVNNIKDYFYISTKKKNKKNKKTKNSQRHTKNKINSSNKIKGIQKMLTQDFTSNLHTRKSTKFSVLDSFRKIQNTEHEEINAFRSITRTLNYYENEKKQLDLKIKNKYLNNRKIFQKNVFSKFSKNKNSGFKKKRIKLSPIFSKENKIKEEPINNKKSIKSKTASSLEITNKEQLSTIEKIRRKFQTNQSYINPYKNAKRLPFQTFKKINFEEFEKKFKSVNSIKKLFSNLLEVGRGSYAIAYLGIERKSCKKRILKTFSLSSFKKQSLVDRFMVVFLLIMLKKSF